MKQALKVALERSSTCQQLVKDNSETVNVAAGPGACHVSSRLLGAHIRRGPENLTIESQQDITTALGKTEVHQNGVPRLIEHDVCGLNVAMNHSPPVSVMQPRSNDSYDFSRLTSLKSAESQRHRERLAVDEG